VNVVVVGAGVIGYAVAYELAARGAQVRIVDPRGHGTGATRASAGILAPYIEGGHSTALLQLGLASVSQYDSFLARVISDAGRDVEYRRIGTLQIALDENQVRELEKQARELARLQADHSLVSKSDLARMEPGATSDARAGLIVPQHGYVGVSSFMAALVAAAARHRVTPLAMKVEAVDAVNGQVHLTTSDGDLTCDVAIIAAGSWCGGISTRPAPPVSVRPVRGQLVQLQSSPGALKHIVWGPACYLVPWKDGTVLVGATVEDVGFDERVTDEGIRQLRDSGERIAPALQSATFVEARAGLRPATGDELPIVGPSSTMPGVFYATGHYRNGVLLAPWTALAIADLVLANRRSSELGLVRPDRFGL
jgi:glycine oxidase